MYIINSVRRSTRKMVTMYQEVLVRNYKDGFVHTVIEGNTVDTPRPNKGKGMSYESIRM